MVSNPLPTESNEADSSPQGSSPLIVPSTKGYAQGLAFNFTEILFGARFVFERVVAQTYGYKTVPQSSRKDCAR